MEKQNAWNIFVVRTFWFLIKNFIKKIIIRLISGYQYFISPFLPPGCKFEVGCSEYAKLAIVNHGLLKGGWLSIVRLLSCHGFSKAQNLN